MGIAQTEFDQHRQVVVGSSRGGGRREKSGAAPGETCCFARPKAVWDNPKVKLGTVILHSRAGRRGPRADSEELVKNSGLRDVDRAEVGSDHRLADPEPLAAMLRACVDACVPEWTDSDEELLRQEWGGLCYTAALAWITVAKDLD